MSLFTAVTEVLNYNALRPEEGDWQYPLAMRFPRKSIGLVSAGTSQVRIGKANFGTARGKQGADVFQHLPEPELVTSRHYGSTDEIVDMIHELGDDITHVAVTLAGDTQVELLSKCDGAGGHEEQYRNLDRNPDGVLARSTSPQETISVVHHPEVQNAVAFITETSRVETIERAVEKSGRSVVRMQSFFAAALTAALQEQGTSSMDILLVEPSEFCFIGAAPDGGWEDITFRTGLSESSLQAAIVETVASREERSKGVRIAAMTEVTALAEYYETIKGGARDNIDFLTLLFA